MRNYQFVEPTYTRREIPLEICQSIYDANAFDPKQWKSGYKTDPDMLPDTVIEFLSLLETLKVDFCIVGGIAYLAYIHDRNTQDLDILISVKELRKVINYVEVTNKDVNFTNAAYKGLKLDFLKTSNKIFEYVKKHETTTHNFVEGAFPVATVRGLIIMRFDAIVDLYQKGNFRKLPRYEYDLQMLTRGYPDIDWQAIWKVSAKFFTDGQINIFKEMVEKWQKPPVNPFA